MKVSQSYSYTVQLGETLATSLGNIHVKLSPGQTVQFASYLRRVLWFYVRRVQYFLSYKWPCCLKEVNKSITEPYTVATIVFPELLSAKFLYFTCTCCAI